MSYRPAVAALALAFLAVGCLLGGEEGAKPSGVGAEVRADKAEAEPGETVTFTANAFRGDLAMVRYQWDFGDGTGVDTTAAVVSHVYEEEGDYQIGVVAHDEAGGTIYAGSHVKVVLYDPGPTHEGPL